ncbi:hypothetical protein LguiA_017322 [Lonicera macranthoides]
MLKRREEEQYNLGNRREVKRKPHFLYKNSLETKRLDRLQLDLLIPWLGLKLISQYEDEEE